MSYADHMAENARLVILRELAQWPDGRLNEVDLTMVLDTFGYLRSREWVRSQLNKMAELGAVDTTVAGTVMIATIKRAGLDHVERRSVIDGIAKPSPVA